MKTRNAEQTTIFRTFDPFVRIQKTLLDDPSLTWEAKGIGCYLHRLPDDKAITPQELAIVGRCKLIRVFECLDALARAGFILPLDQEGTK